jgi:hypothetical protein
VLIASSLNIGFALILASIEQRLSISCGRLQIKCTAEFPVVHGRVSSRTHCICDRGTIDGRPGSGGVFAQ